MHENDPKRLCLDIYKVYSQFHSQATGHHNSLQCNGRNCIRSCSLGSLSTRQFANRKPVHVHYNYMVDSLGSSSSQFDTDCTLFRMYLVDIYIVRLSSHSRYPWLQYCHSHTIDIHLVRIHMSQEHNDHIYVQLHLSYICSNRHVPRISY